MDYLKVEKVQPKLLAVMMSSTEDIKPGPILQLVHKFNGTLGLDKEYDNESQSYNWAQIKRYAIYGCLMAGPALHIW